MRKIEVDSNFRTRIYILSTSIISYMYLCSSRRRVGKIENVCVNVHGKHFF